MTRNDNLARAVCAAGLALSALPLDDLPALATFEIRDDSVDGVRGEAQVGVGGGDELRAVLAWRSAMPAGAAVHAVALTSSPGDWKVEARGRLGGVPVEVWTILHDVPADTAYVAARAGGSMGAAAVLVQHLVDEDGAS